MQDIKTINVPLGLDKHEPEKLWGIWTSWEDDCTSMAWVVASKNESLILAFTTFQDAFDEYKTYDKRPEDEIQQVTLCQLLESARSEWMAGVRIFSGETFTDVVL